MTGGPEPDHGYTFTETADGAWSVEPTTHTGSPWSGDAQHGAPVSMLVHAIAGRAVGDERRAPTRHTVELLRPVPRRRLEASAAIRRSGRRLSTVDVELWDPERNALVVAGRVVWATPSDGPTVVDDRQPALPTVADAAASETDFIGAAFRDHLPPGFHRSLRMRSTLRPTPVIWLRSSLAGLESGSAFSPAQRFVGLGDMATVMATRLRAAATGIDPSEADLGMRLVNTDLTVHLVRQPVGEWVGFCDPHLLVADGVGTASVALLDDLGPVGRSTHTVVSSGR